MLILKLSNYNLPVIAFGLEKVTKNPIFFPAIFHTKAAVSVYCAAPFLRVWSADLNDFSSGCE